MMMSVCLVLKFSSGFKEGGKRSEMIRALVIPSRQKTDANIKKIGEIVQQNLRLSIRAVAELINIDKETVRQILHNNFNMIKVCSKKVPRLFTPEQREIRVNICADILQNIENDPHFLENVITRNESRFFFNTTQIVSANPCTGRAPVHQGKRKHGRANPNLKH